MNRFIPLLGMLALIAGITDAWAIDIETLVMPGKVIAGHADLETECDNCHIAFSRDQQQQLCLNCHESVQSDVRSGLGFHGRADDARTANCVACHTEHEGREADIVGLDPRAFDHELTDFELTGAHIDTECADCHAADALHREAPAACYDCHGDDDEHAGGLGRECKTCHTTKNWTEATFDHEAETDYGLLGAHRRAACTDCHQDNQFSETPTACYDCHRSDDTHEGLNGRECGQCHDTRDWRESFFDHALETSFALAGAHAGAECRACHVEPVHTVSVPTDCFGCHRDDDEHEGLNGQDCGACHVARDWSAITFDHGRDTQFRLLGSHIDLACGDCHVSPVHETPLPGDCHSCHVDDDPHEAQLGEACEQCHNESGWDVGVRFDHGLTLFPLIGEHAGIECDACHESQRFHDAPSQCIDCHLDSDIHDATLGAQCGACHSPVAWPIWVFDHTLQTRFELDGAHTDLACAECHVRPMDDRRPLASNCISCHRSDDVHQGDFGRDCGRCHTTADFSEVERTR